MAISLSRWVSESRRDSSSRPSCCCCCCCVRHMTERTTGDALPRANGLDFDRGGPSHPPPSPGSMCSHTEGALDTDRLPSTVWQKTTYAVSPSAHGALHPKSLRGFTEIRRRRPEFHRIRVIVATVQGQKYSSVAGEEPWGKAGHVGYSPARCLRPLTNTIPSRNPDKTSCRAASGRPTQNQHVPCGSTPSSAETQCLGTPGINRWSTSSYARLEVRPRVSPAANEPLGSYSTGGSSSCQRQQHGLAERVKKDSRYEDKDGRAKETTPATRRSWSLRRSERPFHATSFSHTHRM